MRGKKRAASPPVKQFDFTFRPATYWRNKSEAQKEVMIAVVLLESVAADVISILARRAGGHIHYRVEDEYGTQFVQKRTSSEEPLTFGELVELIDSTDQGTPKELANAGTCGGLTDSCRDYVANADEDCDPEELLDFVAVKSRLYPQLEAYYAVRAREWLDRRRSEQARRQRGK